MSTLLDILYSGGGTPADKNPLKLLPRTNLPVSFQFPKCGPATSFLISENNALHHENFIENT